MPSKRRGAQPKKAAKTNAKLVAAKRPPSKPVARLMVRQNGSAAESVQKKQPVKPVSPAPQPLRAQNVAQSLLKSSAAPLSQTKKVEKVRATPLIKLPKADKPELKVEPKKKLEFRAQDWVVYPAHGVGRIISVEEQEVAGMRLELFVINFEKDKMTLRVPVSKAKTVGMRRLSSPDIVNNALQTLKGRARIKRTMWSRRAQEYEAKINSGDLISIAEVVRDLYRSGGQPEQSYSERQLYEAAIARMAREVAAVEKIDEDAALRRLETALQKAA